MTTTFIVKEHFGLAGHIRKETAEVERAVFDFSQWLDTGEILGSVSRFSLTVQAQVAAVWQVDYPFDPAATVPVITDSVPLILTGATIIAGKNVNVLLGAGTPGLSYVVSFIAIASTSGREKQVNLLVTVPEMTNSAMISSLNPAQSVSFTTVSGTVALALGTTGTVFVENGDAAPITITLPPSPVTGQPVRIVDALGNAATYTITLVGAGGVQILGQSTYTLQTDYQAADLEWNGTQWVVL